MKEYLQKHLNRGDYRSRPLRIPDAVPYQNVSGWEDYALGKHLIFSARSNHYTKETFLEKLHFHDYYELLIPLSGKVEYVCEDRCAAPEFPAAVWFRPGQVHTGKLREECDYERYVFYFRPEAFTVDGIACPLTGFAEGECFFLRLPPSRQEELTDLLKRLIEECRRNDGILLICRALFVEILALLDREGRRGENASPLPEKAVRIREYIDRNYKTISSVEGIAAAFYYSREHLNRIFRAAYNCTVSDYLFRRRVRKGAQLLRDGHTVTESAAACGFSSLPAFTAAFRKEYGVPPSRFREKEIIKME